MQLSPRAAIYLVLRRVVLLCVGSMVLTTFVAPIVSHSVQGPHRPGFAWSVIFTLWAAWLIAFALLAVPTWLYAVLQVRSFEISLDERGLSVSAGVLGRWSEFLPYQKVQDILITQTFLQRLLSLATVSVQNAGATPAVIAGLDASDAHMLREDLLTHTSWDGPASAAASPVRTARSTRATAAAPAVTTGNRQAATGVVPVLLLVAVIALAIVLLHKASAPNTTPEVAPGVAPSPSALPQATAPGPAATFIADQGGGPAPAAPPVVRSAAAAPAVASQMRAPPAQLPQQLPVYALSCAIQGAGGYGARPCTDLAEARRCRHESDFPSRPTAEPAFLTIVNRGSAPLMFYWLDPAGRRALYARLPAGDSVRQSSHIGARWLVADADGGCIAVFDAVTQTIGLF